MFTCVPRLRFILFFVVFCVFLCVYVPDFMCSVTFVAEVSVVTLDDRSSLRAESGAIGKMFFFPPQRRSRIHKATSPRS